MDPCGVSSSAPSAPSSRTTASRGKPGTAGTRGCREARGLSVVRDFGSGSAPSSVQAGAPGDATAGRTGTSVTWRAYGPISSSEERPSGRAPPLVCLPAGIRSSGVGRAVGDGEALWAPYPAGYRSHRYGRRQGGRRGRPVYGLNQSLLLHREARAAGPAEVVRPVRHLTAHRRLRAPFGRLDEPMGAQRSIRHTMRPGLASLPHGSRSDGWLGEPRPRESRPRGRHQGA